MTTGRSIFDQPRFVSENSGDEDLVAERVRVPRREEADVVAAPEPLLLSEQLEVRGRKGDVAANRRGPSGGIGSCTSRTRGFVLIESL
jgi:hypothetical protein